MDLPAENAEIPIIVRAKVRIHVDVLNVKLKSPLPPVQYFIIANSQSAKLSILLIMYAKARKTYPHMNTQGDYL